MPARKLKTPLPHNNDGIPAEEGETSRDIRQKLSSHSLEVPSLLEFPYSSDYSRIRSHSADPPINYSSTLIPTISISSSSGEHEHRPVMNGLGFSIQYGDLSPSQKRRQQVKSACGNFIVFIDSVLYTCSSKLQKELQKVRTKKAVWKMHTFGL